MPLKSLSRDLPLKSREWSVVEQVRQLSMRAPADDLCVDFRRLSYLGCLDESTPR